MNNLAAGYQAAGKLDLALPLFEETLKLTKAKLGPDHPDTLISMNNLAVAYRGRREAGPGPAALRGDAQAPESQARRPTIPRRSAPWHRSGMRCSQSKAWTEAEPLLRECLAIREKTQPDVWPTFNTQSLLGGALLGQKKYADAEPLLLAGLRGDEAAGEDDPAAGARPASPKPSTG